MILPTGPSGTLHTHLDTVIAVVCSPALDAVVSASADGSVILSSLRKRRPIRKIDLQDGRCPVTEMVLLAEDHLVAYKQEALTLEVVTLNNHPVSKLKLEDRLSLLRL